MAIVMASYVIFAPRLHWTGGAAATFAINVNDSGSGQPIAGASVLIRQADESGQPLPLATEAARSLADLTTNSNGEASVTYPFGAGGTTGFFGRSGTVVFRRHVFVVSAPGYETVCVPIEEFTGSNRSIRSSLNFDISFKLKPALASGPATHVAPY